MDLLLNIETLKKIESTGLNSQVILIDGESGSGKKTIALLIASKMLDINVDQLTSYPYFFHIDKNESAITIDVIRDLHNITRLITPGKNTIRRVILIENVQNMTIEAQNAILKQLEEPPSDTLVILTATDKMALLSTVRSRLATITVHGVSLQQSLKYFTQQGKSEQDIAKAFHASGGAVGLMSVLLNSDSQVQIIGYINDAKQLLKKSRHERLVELEKFTTDRQQTKNLVEAIALICQSATRQASSNSQHNTKQWNNRLMLATNAVDMLSLNAQPKLVMTDLLLNL